MEEIRFSSFTAMGERKEEGKEEASYKHQKEEGKEEDQKRLISVAGMVGKAEYVCVYLYIKIILCLPTQVFPPWMSSPPSISSVRHIFTKPVPWAI